MIYQASSTSTEAGGSPADRGRTAGRNGTLPVVGGFPKGTRSDGAGRHPGNAVQSARVVRRPAEAALGRVKGARSPSGREGLQTPADLARLAMVHLQRYATDDAQQGIEILDATALQDRSRAQSWAVKSIIPDNSVGMFFGASKTFKVSLPWITRSSLLRFAVVWQEDKAGRPGLHRGRGAVPVSGSASRHGIA